MSKKLKKKKLKKEPKVPVKGSCPLCFTEYKVEMRQKKGVAALDYEKKLNSQDFVSNYIDVYCLLAESSKMRISVCKDCFNKLDQKQVELAFERTKIIDLDDIMQSRMKPEQKIKASDMINGRKMIFWSKTEPGLIKKHQELFE